MVVRPIQLALLGALTATAAVSAACGGKKGSGSAFGPKQGAVEAPAPAAPPPPPPAVDPGAPTLSANQLRQLTSIVGRAVAGFGTANNTTPLAGVKFYAYVDKKKIESTSDDDGFFWFKDVPVMSEGGVGKNLTIYVDKEGWELDAIPELNPDTTETVSAYVPAAETPDGRINSFQVEVRASPDAPSAFQVDVGPVHLREVLLKFTTSLHHASRTQSSRWLTDGVTTQSGWNEDIYLADPKANITLTFNRVIDTVYSDNRATNPLIEFYDPKGAPVAYAGSWDATKTIFTIDPAADLVADNDDGTNYRISIARPVRALFKDSGSMHELKNATVVFNVLPPSAGDLLLSQAPGLDPQGESMTGYAFDSGTVFKKSLRSSTVEDFTANANSFRIKWTKVANAKGYNVYWRNTFEQASGNLDGIWTKINGALLTPFSADSRPDGTFSFAITNRYSVGGLSVDGKLTAGETVQLVVTAVDVDNNESSINAVTMPLVISDTWKPTITSADQDVNTLSVVRSETGHAAFTRSVSVTFSEVMDTANADQAPAVVGLSGAAAIAGANGRWLSRTNYVTDLNYTYKQPETTITTPAASGQDKLVVDAANANFRFVEGDVVLIKSSNANDPDDNNPATHTILEIDTANSVVQLTAGLGRDYPTGSTMYLLTRPGNNGLTSIDAKATAAVPSGRTELAITAGRGARFFVGRTVTIYAPDEEAWTPLSPGMVLAAVEADKLTFTLPLEYSVPAGALILDSAVAAAEPSPRGRVTFQLDQNAEFTDNTVATTATVNDHQGAPDALPNMVMVGAVTNLAENDLVTIAASNVTANLTAEADNATSLTMTGHPFLEGDEVVLEGTSFPVTLTDFNAGNTTFTINAVRVFAGDVIRIYDPAFSTKLSDPVADNATSLVVTDVSGFAVNQSIIVSDGVNTFTRTISAINVATRTLTVATITEPLPATANVQRARVPLGTGFNNLTVNASSSGTTLTSSANAQGYSTKAVMRVDRDAETRTLTSVAANTITFAGAVSRANGATVRLRSYPETMTIQTIDQGLKRLTFTANLKHPHRAGVAVTKAPQDWVEVDTDWNTIDRLVVLGDTIVIDTLPAGPQIYSHADRLTATVAAIDAVNKRLKLTLTKDGVIITTNANLHLLGDGVGITTVPDANANAANVFDTRFSTAADDDIY